MYAVSLKTNQKKKVQKKEKKTKHFLDSCVFFSITNRNH